MRDDTTIDRDSSNSYNELPVRLEYIREEAKRESNQLNLLIENIYDFYTNEMDGGGHDRSRASLRS